MVVWSSYRYSLLAGLHTRHELDADVSCGFTIIVNQLLILASDAIMIVKPINPIYHCHRMRGDVKT